ncbi:hypothetical protein NL676_038040 [Syzygium grande]|nr:hypothetical protein NL676_038040 [Syzygium grande]
MRFLSSIQFEGFRSLAKGETEFQIEFDGNRSKAINMTGPDGATVQGSSRSDGGTRAGVKVAEEGARLWWQVLVRGGAEEWHPEATASLGEGGIRELRWRTTGAD